MRYAITFFLLAGAVLGFGQTDCEMKWLEGDIRMGSAAINANIDCAQWILDHPGSSTPPKCGQATAMVDEFVKHHDAGSGCKSPAKPVAPSKQKQTIKGDVNLQLPINIEGGHSGPPILDEKQLGEWIERNCKIRPKPNTCITCGAGYPIEYELHCTK